MDSAGVLGTLFLIVSVSAEGQNITATIGQDVALPCNAEDYMPFEVVEWSRSGTDTKYVLIFDKQNPTLKVPEQSYEGRVELKNMQTGDVSLVLKNVIAEDSGIYECYVVRDTNRRKRDIKPVCTFYLDVAPPPCSGRGHILVLVVFALVVSSLVVFTTLVFIWKKRNVQHDEAKKKLLVTQSN